MNSEQNTETAIFQVIEENLQIDKKVVETGRTKLSKSVEEQKEQKEIELSHEEIEIEHVPVNQFIETVPSSFRYEGDTMIIPIIEEVAVIEKKLMLKEEVRITKKKVNTTEVKEVMLKKEKLNIEKKSNLDNT